MCTWHFNMHQIIQWCPKSVSTFSIILLWFNWYRLITKARRKTELESLHGSKDAGLHQLFRALSYEGWMMMTDGWMESSQKQNVRSRRLVWAASSNPGRLASASPTPSWPSSNQFLLFSLLVSFPVTFEGSLPAQFILAQLQRVPAQLVERRPPWQRGLSA